MSKASYLKNGQGQDSLKIMAVLLKELQQTLKNEKQIHKEQ